jgi:predicted ABC-class ATPase
MTRPDDRQLQHQLQQLDGASYKAYKDLRGSYDFPGFCLWIDHVQGDPFAAPSQLRVQLSLKETELPPQLYQAPIRTLALEDFLIRRFDYMAQRISQRRGTGKSGQISIIRPGQAVLKRSAAQVWPDRDMLEMRFTVGLPAQGRRILGRQAAALLCEDLIDIVEESLFYDNLNPKAVQQQVEVVEDGEWLRNQLAAQGLVAFVANGAILARASGVDQRPLAQAIPFQSPAALQVSFDCPNQGKIKGMGIPQGVTLIVGGGYHGKSTLLKAIEQGIYNHIPGDGREYVVTDPSAVKIRAEDGRSIAQVDISPFINHLPLDQSTQQFSTPNASGSTSQAASIIEALEVGSQLLLMDEDTSATNFMIRDRRMQALIQKDHEPITPFVDKVKQLHQDYQVSTILVMGGSGDYFDVADTVIAMDHFCPQEVTAQAQAIAQTYATQRIAEGGKHFGTLTPRYPQFNASRARSDSGNPPYRGRRRGEHQEPEERPSKTKARGVNVVLIDKEEIDLAAVEQLVETGQLRGIAAALVQLRQSQGQSQGRSQGDGTTGDGKAAVAEMIDRLMEQLTQSGLDSLSPFPPSDFVTFRRFELAAALNRWRSLQ